MLSLVVPVVQTAPPLDPSAAVSSWPVGSISLRWDVGHQKSAQNPTTVHAMLCAGSALRGYAYNTSLPCSPGVRALRFELWLGRRIPRLGQLALDVRELGRAGLALVTVRGGRAGFRAATPRTMDPCLERFTARIPTQDRCYNSEPWIPEAAKMQPAYAIVPFTLHDQSASASRRGPQEHGAKLSAMNPTIGSEPVADEPDRQAGKGLRNVAARQSTSVAR